jgi:hypothetical protein
MTVDSEFSNSPYLQDPIYLEDRQRNSPYLQSPIYLEDRQRLIRWLKDHLDEVYEPPVSGEAQEDYYMFSNVLAMYLGIGLARKYERDQPTITWQELSPFVLTSDAADEFKKICFQAGVSERTYWFLYQAWMRGQVILACINYYIADETDQWVLDVKFLSGFTNILCGAFYKAAEQNDS